MLFCVLISMLMAVIYNYSTVQTLDKNTLYGAYEVIVGYSDFVELSVNNLEGIFLIYILSFPVINSFVKNFSKNAVYIFTRIKSRSKWLISKQLSVGFYAFLISAVYFAAKLLLSGSRIHFINLLVCFLIFFLSVWIFCCAVCTLSLLTGTVKSYIIMVILYSVLGLAVTFYYLNYSTLTAIAGVILNPAARFMLNWNYELSEMMPTEQFLLLNPTVSIIYFIAILIIINVISVIIINKNNISLWLFDEE